MENYYYSSFFSDLSIAQRSFAKCLQEFTFECIGGTQTDDELVICASLKTFSDLILQVEDERDRMVSLRRVFVANNNSIPPLPHTMTLDPLRSRQRRHTMRIIITIVSPQFFCEQGRVRINLCGGRGGVLLFYRVR